MHVCSPNNGYILGVRAAASTSNVHAAYRSVPHPGHSGLRQDLCSVHEGD